MLFRSLSGTPWACNGQLPGTFARRHARSAPDAEAALADAVEGFSLSGRGFDRTVKVGLTLADLEGSDRVEVRHVREALAFRAMGQQQEVAPVG